MLHILLRGFSPCTATMSIRGCSAPSDGAGCRGVGGADCGLATARGGRPEESLYHDALGMSCSRPSGIEQWIHGAESNGRVVSICPTIEEKGEVLRAPAAKHGTLSHTMTGRLPGEEAACGVQKDRHRDRRDGRLFVYAFFHIDHRGIVTMASRQEKSTGRQAGARDRLCPFRWR